MDDLISRKRALEEMTFSCGIEQDGVLYVPLRDVNNHLKSLPSVQPEILACGSGELKVQPEVDEWCTDCPAYDNEKHNCPRFNRVIRETVEEIQENQIPENSAWFRISETLVDESKGDITAEQAVDKIRDYMRKMEKPGRKKGKWFLTDTMYACDQCHSVFYETSPFCPNCGSYNGGKNEV